MDEAREAQRSRLRRERAPTPDTLVLRGGPDNADKLRRHASRTARSWSLDGVPLFGVSVFCALDEVGPASVTRLIESELRTYRWIHACTTAELEAAGITLMPTGRRPHVTALLSDVDGHIEQLLATLGAPHDNRDGRASVTIRSRRWT